MLNALFIVGAQDVFVWWFEDVRTLNKCEIEAKSQVGEVSRDIILDCLSRAGIAMARPVV